MAPEEEALTNPTPAELVTALGEIPEHVVKTAERRSGHWTMREILEAFLTEWAALGLTGEEGET